MTISTESLSKAGPFLGNGATTTFPFTFKVFATDQITATFTNNSSVDSVLVLNSAYSVVLNPDQDANPGGSVTYPISGAPLKAAVGAVPAERLTITGDVPATQGTDLTNGGPWNPTVVENALDKLTLLIQQLTEQASRSIKTPVSDTAPGLTLPTAEVRANRFLAFDSSGVPIVATSPTPGALVVSPFIETLLDDVDAKTARGTLLGVAYPAWSSAVVPLQITPDSALYSFTTSAQDDIVMVSGAYLDAALTWRYTNTGGYPSFAAVDGGGTPSHALFGAVPGTAGGVATLFEYARQKPGTLSLTGHASFTPSGGSAGGVSVLLDAVSTANAAVFFRRGVSSRWDVNMFDGGGADDWRLSRYDNAGAYVDDVLSASRATGLLTVKGNPTAALGIATKQYVDGAATPKASFGFSLSSAMSGVADGSGVTSASSGTLETISAGDVIHVHGTSVGQVTATAAAFFKVSILNAGTAVFRAPQGSSGLGGVWVRQVTTGPSSLEPHSVDVSLVCTTGGTLAIQQRVMNHTGAAGTNTVTFEYGVTRVR